MKSSACASVASDYLRQHKGLFIRALFWRGLYVIVPMQVPVITGAIIDGLTQESLSVYGFGWKITDPTIVLWSAVAALLTVALAYGYSSYARLMAAARLSRNFVFDLRRRIIQHASRLSLEQHSEFGAAELLERTMTDTRGMRRFLDRVYIQTTANFLRLGYPVIMLLILDWSLALVALAVLAPQWLVERQLHRRLHAAADQRRTTQSELTTVVKENFDGIETIKSLDAHAATITGIEPCAEQLEQDELLANKFTALINANVWCMTSIGLAAVWGLGGMRVLTGSMTLGNLVMFTGFVAFVYQPFRQFSAIVSTYRQGLVSLQRIADLLQVAPSISDAADARPLVCSAGRVELQSVDFSYGSRQVLIDVTLDIPPRQITAIVGRSGSGKSSLLRLIPRLFDPNYGAVSIDGQQLAKCTLDSIRSQVAMVTQQPRVFSGSVLENIRLAAPDAPMREVRRACVQAGALAFIENLEKGFDTIIGMDDARLSGGQVQRLALARALLIRPHVLLLDEPTSALDAASEAAIIRTLRRLRQEMTILIVAHRPLTARHADHVVVMEEGRVDSFGSHDELLHSSSAYHEMFQQHKLSYVGAA